MNHKQLKALACRAGRAKGEERRRLVEKLMEELPKLDPFEGFSEGAVWLAKLVARLKWSGAEWFS
jgi:hypothetical protein